MSWNATFCAPVAASPESWSSAVVRLLPVRLKSDTKAGGSAPPLLKKLSIAWPTLSSLTVKVGSGGADGCSGSPVRQRGPGGSPGSGGIGRNRGGSGTSCALRLSNAVLPV